MEIEEEEEKIIILRVSTSMAPASNCLPAISDISSPTGMGDIKKRDST